MATLRIASATTSSVYLSRCPQRADPCCSASSEVSPSAGLGSLAVVGQSCGSLSLSSAYLGRRRFLPSTSSRLPAGFAVASKIKVKDETKEEKKERKKLEKEMKKTEGSLAGDEEEKSEKKEKKSKKDKKNGSLTGGVLEFVKYQGLGNDFLLVDNRDSAEPKISPDQAVKILDRNFGVGGDGVIFALPGTNECNYTMRIFNSDGSEPEMCGNGIRCLAKFLAELEEVKEGSYKIDTLAGPILPKIRKDGQVVVDMGEPILKADSVPTTLVGRSGDGAAVRMPIDVAGTTWFVTCVSMGNPHCITFLDQGLDVKGVPLAEIGPKFENHPAFPARTNTEFIQVLSPSHVRMRVWERGAGATLACGTGACAVVVAGVLEGRTDRTCTVDLPGGPLEIEWREEDNHVYMTGPAQMVFWGEVAV